MVDPVGHEETLLIPSWWGEATMWTNWWERTPELSRHFQDGSSVSPGESWNTFETRLGIDFFIFEALNIGVPKSVH